MRTFHSIDPARVRVGKRHRRDLGDLQALARSIDEIGFLLQPIGVTPAGDLLYGERRLRAWALSRFASSPIPCRVLDLDEIVRAEAAENMMRKDFTPSEAVAIAEALRPLEEAAARERMKAGKRPSGKLPQGRVRDLVARKVGMSGKNLDKATAIVKAAKADPKRFGKLKADMDRSGRVHGPHKRLVVAIKADAIKASPPPFPNRWPYHVAVADVPWPYDKDSDDPGDRGTHPYPQMSLTAIEALGKKVRELLHADAVLFFWSTNHHLEDAYRIVRAWGFAPASLLTWGKPKFGHGHWLRSQTEHAIVAVRGSPAITLTNQSTLLLAPVGAHSAKPDAFYELVERLCPAPRYLELFARRARPNWDGFGDEARADAA